MIDGIIKEYNKFNNYDELENIKIINNKTKEEIALITLSEGMINIKTEEPYRIYANYKKENGLKEEANNEIK